MILLSQEIINKMFRLEKNPLTEDLNAFDSQVKDSEEPLPSSGSQSWLICGKPGTGKSTLLLRAITSSKSTWCACKNFDLVFLCSPSAKHDPKFGDLVGELSEDGRYYDTFDEKVLDEILDRVDAFNHQYKKDVQEYSETKKDGKGFYSREVGQDKRGKPIMKKIYEKPLLPRHLLILDDVVNDLPKSTQKSKINALFCNHRHKKLCIITVSQIYNKLNPIIRRGANVLSVFRTDNKAEYEALENDLAVDSDKFKKIYDFATDKLNSFLHIQLCGARPIYFKKFDRIISS
jgi:hypothetical protein